MKITITKGDLELMESKLNFGKDIKIGKIGEKMARQYLEQVGCTFVRESEGQDFKKWDIEMMFKSIPRTYEVKTDVLIRPDRMVYSEVFKKEMLLKGRETGNMFVEYQYRGVPSGIATTEADVWVYFFHHLNEVWIIKVDELRKLIAANDFPRFLDAGDEGSNTMGYLLPRFEHKELFKVVQYEREVI
jgi:hypothetical protein